jgi:CRP-like cAMP-binding protein
LDSSFFSKFEHVPLPVRTVLYNVGETPRYVHLMTSGIASIVNLMSDGGAIEVGMIGREGFPEHVFLLGPHVATAQCYIQVEGTALRMPFRRFQEEFQRNPLLHSLVLEDVQYEALALNQLSACNRLHEVEERLARWLLMVEDRVGHLTAKVTQEFLGIMLGARRSSVTVVAGTLQRAGLIEYRRGNVKILDRERLEQAACECYGVVRELYGRLYQPRGKQEPTAAVTTSGVAAGDGKRAGRMRGVAKVPDLI